MVFLFVNLESLEIVKKITIKNKPLLFHKAFIKNCSNDKYEEFLILLECEELDDTQRILLY